MNRPGAVRKIALTVWGQRISPVFDVARGLLIVEIDGHTFKTAARLSFNPDRPQELLQLLRTQEVTLLICGAVSEQPAALIETAGIELIPFVTGDIDRVLEGFLENRLIDSECRMPGCGRAVCCRGRIRRGQNIGPSQPGQGRASVLGPSSGRRQATAASEAVGLDSAALPGTPEQRED